MAILVVGSVAFDSIETPFGKVQETLGGSATYFAYAASFFSPIQLVAVVGSDFPKETIKMLQDKGISTDGLEVAPGKTFRWSGYYENDMNSAHTRSTDLNVFQSFKPKIPDHYKRTPYVFLANIDPDLQLNVLENIEVPRLVGCDTMNLWIQTKPHRLKQLLKKVNIFLLNDGEARQLTGITNLIKAGNELLKMGPRVVVIKKGEHGAILFTENFFFVSPGYPVEDVFDPTGAGDCFAGGFFASLTANNNYLDETALRQAIIFGTVIASFNVESFSLERLKTLTRKDILDRFNTFKKFTHFEPADHSTSFPASTAASR